MEEIILVSGCIIGTGCRYDGKQKYFSELMLNLFESNTIVSVCPEMLAGLGVPRTPIEIQGGDGKDVIKGNAKVMDKEGKEITEQILEGCKKAMDMIKEIGIKKAILYDKSPTCGSTKIYDGKFEGNLIEGVGVLTAMLEKEGIEVISHDSFLK